MEFIALSVINNIFLWITIIRSILNYLDKYNTSKMFFLRIGINKCPENIFRDTGILSQNQWQSRFFGIIMATLSMEQHYQLTYKYVRKRRTNTNRRPTDPFACRIGFVLRFVLSLIGHVVVFFLLIYWADLWRPMGYPISDLNMHTLHISHTTYKRMKKIK